MRLPVLTLVLLTACTGRPAQVGPRANSDQRTLALVGEDKNGEDKKPSQIAPANTPALAKSEHVTSVTEDGRPGSVPPAVRTAETDMGQARYGSLPAPSYSPERCKELLGASVACAPVVRGPLVVTDLRSLGTGCSDQSLALVHGEDLDTEIVGPFSIHGARLVIPIGYELFFIQAVPETKPKPAEGIPLDTSKPAVKAIAKPGAVQAAANTPVASTETSTKASRSTCGLLWSGYVPYPDDTPRSNVSRMGNPYRRK